MFTSLLLERYLADDGAKRVAARMLGLAAEHDQVDRFLQAALSLLLSAGCDYVALMRGERGQWRTVAQSGSHQAAPDALLAGVLDQGGPRASGSFAAAPLWERAALGEVLLVHAAGRGEKLPAMADALAALIATGLEAVRQRQAQRRRIERLEAILGLAAQWNQTLELDQLLVQMAETSCRLLTAERASIFLWDRPNKLLVGRPALGVEGGELRVSDSAGVVGAVVQSGQPRRVDQDADQSEIDRQTDQKLNFKTRSLLCVPLLGRSGELLGAFEMINKRSGNFTDDDQAALIELAGHAGVALENTQQYEQLLKSRNQLTEQAASGVQLLGECPAIVALQSTVRRVAATDLPVLVLGENGSGKEVVCQMIHYLSRRRNEPFLAVNCAAIAESLLESELFGHEKGAFTDARETRQGKFELASGGTLFLDEIGDLSLAGQAKLLRVLEDKQVVRVGGSQSIHTDARVLAATNQNLPEMVRSKRFREDLFFRLNVVTLDLPPLRERGDDVLLLADQFLAQFAARARRRAPKLTAAARKRLSQHAWPGNIRELRNLMERLAFLTQGDKIDADDLSFILAPGRDQGPAMSLDQSLAEATDKFQSDFIRKHIAAAKNNMSDAARRLGLHRSNLYRKMRQLGMEVALEE